MLKISPDRHIRTSTPDEIFKKKKKMQPSCWDFACVDVESRALNTTGGHVWNAARVLADRLSRGKWNLGRVLEIGAGTGWLGLVVAANVDNTHVVITDQSDASAQALLHANLEQKNPHLLSKCSVGVCDFFLESSVEQHRWSTNQWTLIIGSDLVYTKETALGLARTLKRLLDVPQEAVFLYAHTFRRYDFLDAELLRESRALGLKVEEMVSDEQVVEASATSDEGEVEELELFPEQRVAILRFTNNNNNNN